METIGDRLRELRGSLTQPQMARIAGTTKQYVSQLEGGANKTPNSVYLEAWARHFGVSIQWLVTGKGERQAASQPARLDAAKLADLIETVDATVAGSIVEKNSRLKARWITTIYLDPQLSEASRETIEAMLHGFIANMEETP